MDSPARTNPRMAERLLPFWAVLVDDLRQTTRHWAIWSWGVLALLAALVWSVSAQPTASPRESVPPTEAAAPVEAVVVEHKRPTAAEFGGRILGAHLLLWAAFVIALGASTISAEAEIAPEAILCRGVSRWQYYLSKCISRAGMVAVLFTVLTSIPIGLAALRLDNDLNFSATVHAMWIGLLYLCTLTLIGVAASSWFGNALISVVVCWMGLYGVGIVVAVLELSGLSPVGLSAQLPLLLRGEQAIVQDHHLLTVLTTTALLSTTVSLGHFSFRDV